MKLYHNGVFGEFTKLPIPKRGDIDVESRDISSQVGSIVGGDQFIAHEYVPSLKEVFYNQLKEVILKLPGRNTLKMYNTTTREWNREEGGQDIAISILFWWDIGSSNNYKDGWPSIVLHASRCKKYETPEGTDMDNTINNIHVEMIGALSDLIFKKYPTMNYASMEKSVNAFITRIAPLFLEGTTGGERILYSETEKIWLECVDTVMSMKPPSIVALDKP